MTFLTRRSLRMPFTATAAVTTRHMWLVEGVAIAIIWTIIMSCIREECGGVHVTMVHRTPVGIIILAKRLAPFVFLA